MTYFMTRLFVVPTLLLLLIGCGGEATEQTAPQADNAGVNYDLEYSVPEVELFRYSLWEGLVDDCGTCHGDGGEASEYLFVQNDFNAAYEVANRLIDRDTPGRSVIANKVLEDGHRYHCWDQSNITTCVADITRFIEVWLGKIDVTPTETIQLTAPDDPDRVPGDSKSFPDTSDAPAIFTDQVYPILVSNCVECHAESASTPQAPFVANADVDAAYIASRDKIDLDTPANSRLVIRLRQEFHNCWSDDCQADADEMQAAIKTFADDITPTEVDPQLIISMAQLLGEGVTANDNKRHDSNVIALYEFKTGSGSVAKDTSGVEPAIDLNLSGKYSWVNGWGIEFRGGKARGLTSTSQKLTAYIRGSGAYTIEAWVTPSTVTQTGPARIISYSAGTDSRNFTLGQALYNYEFLNRSSTTDVNGEPSLATADDDEVLQSTQQHVVVTFDTIKGRQIYVNGRNTGDIDPLDAGNLAAWDDSFALFLGNEASDDRPWHGKLRMVAIHNRALTPEQVEKNFLASVGEKFFLLFNISDRIAVPGSYIVFEAAMYDSYSYLFSKPRYIYLGDAVPADNVAIEGIRIGINGKEAKAGQAFDKVNSQLDGDLSTTELGQPLSRLGTTIPMEKGMDFDEFFLTFEVLGSGEHRFKEPAVEASDGPTNEDFVPDIGLRTFDEINASMSAITGVSMVENGVQTAFETIKQQLPSVESIEGFLSSHQVAIAQLSFEYCNALVEDTTLRDAFFPGFDFDVNANSVADGTWDSLVVTPLIEKVSGINLDSQPLSADIRTELMALLIEPADLKPYDADGNSVPDGEPDGLARCGELCDVGRTKVATKAACSVILGSAVVLLQ